MRVAVTGAYGYSGRYMARRLLAQGHEVLTLTNSMRRSNPFGDQVKPQPFNFDNPALLKATLREVDVLINNYWVRFNMPPLFTHAEAVRNAKVLFDAAKRAGVARIVHISITNPDRNSDLPYFSGKAEMEEHLKSTGLSHCILRPTVLFGKEDILINNIAWGLRYLPVFGIFGDGRYRLQPIHVDDLAEAVVLQAHARTNATIDAIGPETFRYRDMVEMIAEAIGVRPCRRQHFAKCVPSVLPGFAFMRRPSTRRAPTPAGKGLVASRLRTAPANVHRLLSGERAQRPKASQTASLKRLLTARTQLLARSEVFQNPSPVPSANGCYAWYFCEVAKIVPHGAA